MLEERLMKYTRILHRLTIMQENDQISLKGEHLNIMDSVQNQMMSGILPTEDDLQKLEMIIMEFL